MSTASKNDKFIVIHGIRISSSSAADEYLPKNREFHVGFDAASPYAYWDDTKRGLKATLKKRASRGWTGNKIPPAYVPPALKFRIVSPDNTETTATTRYWVCFDKANGHKGSHRYVWLFNTEADAKYHYEQDQSDKSRKTCLPPIMVIAA